MKFLEVAALLNLSIAFGLISGLTVLGYDLGWLGLVLFVLIPFNWLQFARRIWASDSPEKTT